MTTRIGKNVPPEVRREKLVGMVIQRLEHARAVEQARAALKPLVERSRVSPELKRRAITPGAPGLTAQELDLGTNDAELHDVLRDFLDSGKIKVNTRGAYELGTLTHEIDVKAAADLLPEVLVGWPQPACEKILEQLDPSGGGSGEE